MQALVNLSRSSGASALLLLGLFAGLPGAVPLASAQAYPCPGGPGPGEQQIGVGGGTHGVAAVPMCVADGGDYAGEAPPAYDPMAAAMAEAWREAEGTHRDVLEAGGEQFQAAVNVGGWDVFEAAPEAAPGES
jgi:hypothetical protein